MSEVLIVFRREFLERVRTRSFLIGTFMFPVLMILLYTLPMVLGGDKAVRRVAVVDESPAGVGRTLAAVLNDTTEDREGRRYAAEVVARPLAEVKDDLTRRVLAKELDGYVHIPADVTVAGQVAWRARNVGNLEAMGDVRRAASRAVQAERLRQAGLRAADVISMLRPVDVTTARITASGEEGGSAVSTFFVGYIAAMLMFTMILTYGVNVMRSVLEEKTNRIAEVIVSSMRATHLMLGKIVGVGAVALLQVTIWMVLIGAGTRLVGSGGERGGFMDQALAALKVNPVSGLLVLGFFVFGFFLYASIFAALGAAVNSDQEAQQMQQWAMLPLLLPLPFMFKVLSDPLGPTATILGLIPFTAPVTNAIRLGTVEIPLGQALGSLALLALTTLAMAWLAGKIYRVGILSTGKRPTLGELRQWLKAA